MRFPTKQQLDASYQRGYREGEVYWEKKLSDPTFREQKKQEAISIAKHEALQKERVRCSAILNGPGSVEMKIEAIKNGSDPNSLYKRAFEELHSSNSSRSSSSASMPVGSDFMSIVKQYAKEHNCLESDAVLAVAQKFPQLHKEYVDSAH